MVVVVAAAAVVVAVLSSSSSCRMYSTCCSITWYELSSGDGRKRRRRRKGMRRNNSSVLVVGDMMTAAELSHITHFSGKASSPFSLLTTTYTQRYVYGHCNTKTITATISSIIVHRTFNFLMFYLVMPHCRAGQMQNPDTHHVAGSPGPPHQCLLLGEYAVQPGTSQWCKKAMQ